MPTARSARLPALLIAAALLPACATVHRAASDATPAPAPTPASAATPTPVPVVEPLVTDRPDFTESPLVVPAHSFQLEAGHSVTRSHGETEHTVGELLLRVGLLPRAELRLAGNSVVLGREQGGNFTALEDAGIGVKLSLIPEREGRHLLPTTAILLGTSLPTGSSRLRSKALTPEAKLALAWSLAEGWDLSSNLNVANIPAGVGERAQEYVGSLSVGHDLGERLGAYAELYGGRTSIGDPSRFFNAGVTFAVAPLLQLDARAGSGFGPSAGVRFLGVGIAHRW